MVRTWHTFSSMRCVICNRSNRASEQNATDEHFFDIADEQIIAVSDATRTDSCDENNDGSNFDAAIKIINFSDGHQGEGLHKKVLLNIAFAK